MTFPAMTQLFHFISLSSLPPRLIPLPRHVLVPADPGVGGAQRQKRARLADDLTEKIQLRPGPLELHNKNILPLETCECPSPPLGPATEQRHAATKRNTAQPHATQYAAQSGARQLQSVPCSAFNASQHITQHNAAQCIRMLRHTV